MTANLRLYERGQACRTPWPDDDPIHSPRAAGAPDGLPHVAAAIGCRPKSALNRRAAPKCRPTSGQPNPCSIMTLCAQLRLA